MSDASTRLWTKNIYGPLQDKTLKNVLIKKLVDEYGYSDKIRIAETLVDDLLEVVDEYFPEQKRLKPGQTIWYAVDIDDKHTQGKKLRDSKLKPVILTLINKEDLEDYAKGKPMKDITEKQMLRMFHEAKDQGGVLSQIDMSVLLSIRHTNISMKLKRVKEKTGEPVPTRGQIHDLGRTTTHKKEIIELYRKGYLTPEIARITKHDRTNVDAYIRDYERVKLLADKFNQDEISHLTKMSKKLVGEYLEILNSET
ncbi:MAG: DUF1670 domain-containing protein [Candidatus Altiarchaeota archaeon]|nr:DUF1670 domain-containing protein [Candidatus Altiarchaeota archaeon]